MTDQEKFDAALSNSGNFAIGLAQALQAGVERKELSPKFAILAALGAALAIAETYLDAPEAVSVFETQLPRIVEAIRTGGASNFDA